MTEREVILEQARRLVGRTVSYQGLPCRIRDILEDPPTFVLHVLDGHGEITADSYGHPRRKGPRVIEVPLWREDGTVNPEVALIRTAGV